MHWTARERWCLAAVAQPIERRGASHEWLGGAPRLVKETQAARERLTEQGLGTTVALEARIQQLTGVGAAVRDVAFNAICALDLLGQGYLSGLLLEADVWRQSFELSEQLTHAFQSWPDLGSSYLTGKHLVTGDIDEQDEATLKALLEEPGSPWRRLAFDDWSKATGIVLANHPRSPAPEAVIVAPPARSWQLSVEQRRGQALWAVIAATDGASLARLGGWPRTEGFIRGTRAALEAHGIADREALFARLARLREQASSAGSFTARDTAWGVTYANWGFLVGHLEEDEAWSWIAGFADLQRSSCDSWVEFARQLIEGERKGGWNPRPMHVAAVERLLSDPSSSWLTLEWFGANVSAPFPRVLECLTLDLALSCPCCAREIVPEAVAGLSCTSCGESVPSDEAAWELTLARDALASRRLSPGEHRERYDLGMVGRSWRRYKRGPVACAACEAPFDWPQARQGQAEVACGACGLVHRCVAADSRLWAIDEDAVGQLEPLFPTPPPGTVRCSACGAGVAAPSGSRSVTCPSCKGDNILPSRVVRALQPAKPRLLIVRARPPDLPTPPGSTFQLLTLGDCPPMTSATALTADGGDPSVVNAEPWLGFAQTGADRFALTLVALDADGARAASSFLGGRLRTSDAARGALKRLREVWAVGSRAELVERLALWGEPGARGELGAYFQWLAANPGSWTPEGLAAGDSDKLRKWQVALELAAAGKTKGIAALDGAWIVGSAGDGYLAGWLSADEAWDAARGITREVQQAYDSWDEFVDYTLIGRRFVGMAVSDELIRRGDALLADETSPFRRISWSTDLDAADASTESPLVAWFVRLGVECAACRSPMPALSREGASVCTVCGSTRVVSLERACDVLRRPLAHAQSTSDQRLDFVDVRSDGVFHVDLRRAAPACPHCRGDLDADWLDRAAVAGELPCTRCKVHVQLVRPGPWAPPLQRLHPRLYGLLQAESVTVKVPKQLVCGGCGAGLALVDARPIDCRYCGARNFLGDALAAALHGRTAPRELVVLLGDHTTRLHEGVTTMLVDGEPLSVGAK